MFPIEFLGINRDVTTLDGSALLDADLDVSLVIGRMKDMSMYGGGTGFFEEWLRIEVA